VLKKRTAILYWDKGGSMMNRLTITLEQPEYAALLQMAMTELRTPPDQLRHILRLESERRGLWPLGQVADAPQNQKREGSNV